MQILYVTDLHGDKEKYKRHWRLPVKKESV
jgi:hypothetical protein